MSDRPIHVVGGGIAGLVAAITAAEAGAPVVLYEASGRLGGRALGGTEESGVNLGPHLVLTDGALLRWLRAHDVMVLLRVSPVRGFRFLDDGGCHAPLTEIVRLARTVRRMAVPVDQSFREWSDRIFETKTSALLCRLTGLYTFHHDPGSLSARFVWDRYRRIVLRPDRVRWIGGGWSTLIDALAQRARVLGVQVETGVKITRGLLPGGPLVVATSLTEAARLLDHPLHWPGARTVLLDVITHSEGRWPALVVDVRSDLSTCCMIERETAIEPGLVGPGMELLQAHLGIASGVGIKAGVTRVEDALDRSIPGWRAAMVWNRAHVVANSTGAVDPPRTTWRDRPAIVQGDDRFLAGDAVAAPGVLSEVSVNSAVHAARLALEARRQRAFSVGWPRLDLTPERRFEILAATLPSSVLEIDQDAAPIRLWAREPVDETGPGYSLTRRGPLLSGAATSRDGRISTLTATRSRRIPRPLLRLLTRAVEKLRLTLDR